MKTRHFIGILAVLLFFSSCYEDYSPEMTEDRINRSINRWIHNTMSLYYFWASEIPEHIEYEDIDPVDFFNSLLVPQDKFSSIITHSENLGGITSIRESYGFETVFGYLDENRTRIGGIVLYVFPNSIAEKEGVKRGDIFIAIDEVALTISNLGDLFQQNEAVFTFIRHEIGGNTTFNKVLSRESQEVSPVHTQNIIEAGNKRIGYLLYNQFVADNGDGSSSYVDEILECFKNFKENGINELVVDFRYNSGGLIEISALIASLIVPNVDTTKVAFHFSYNERLQSVIAAPSLFFSEHTDSYVGNNLNRVFFIVSSSTASASEAVISALLPYMEVVLVGETTYGKNFASALFTNNNQHSETKYSIMPTIIKVYNANNESNYDNGFAPDYQINEFMYPLRELGNPQETKLNYILSSILGVYPENRSITRNVSPRFFSPITAIAPIQSIVYEFHEHER
jgi:C-terminal processing protease CtpA/Prc